MSVGPEPGLSEEVALRPFGSEAHSKGNAPNTK
jgi:hypothetical protein